MTRPAVQTLAPLLAFLAAACATRPAAPAPGPAEHHAAHPASADPDVRFMQGMIAHHAQALEMTRLVPARSGSRDIHLLADRIDVSQQDEIALMQGWLRSRGHPAPDAGHAHVGGLMPGMLTAEEMAALSAATAAEFDRRFLESMIRHHEGALVMVAELFAAPGAAQDSEIYQFASDVDADQRAEIARMRRLLGG